MASLKEDLYDTLASFPDGAFTSQKEPQANNETELGRNLTSSDTALNSDSVDHVAGRIPSRISTSSLRAGLSGVQKSSMQLLQAVDALETRQDTDREQLHREIAKLEFNMSKTIEEHKEELRRYHDGLTTELNLSADLRRLGEKVETMRKDLQEKNAQQSDTIYRLETLATKFFVFEKQVNSAIGPSLQDKTALEGTLSQPPSSSQSDGADQGRHTHRRRGVRQGVPHRRHPHASRERVRGERY